jgi:membrane-bound serine protease (ClpP class)
MIVTWAFVIALALFGCALLILELFVIPGFGVTGIAGILAVLGATYYANASLGMWQAAVVFLVSLVVSYFVVSRATKSGTLTKLKNPAKSPGKVGDDSGGGARRPPVGTRGVAATPLRPAGIIQIGDRRYDVVVEGPIVDPGQAVEIVGYEGNIVKVRAI